MATSMNFTPRPEADVVINGVRLTHGQSMTLRVAVSSFIMNLSEDPYMVKNLGEIRLGYIARGREVEKLMIEGNHG